MGRKSKLKQIRRLQLQPHKSPSPWSKARSLHRDPVAAFRAKLQRDKGFRASLRQAWQTALANSASGNGGLPRQVVAVFESNKPGAAFDSATFMSMNALMESPFPLEIRRAISQCPPSLLPVLVIWYDGHPNGEFTYGTAYFDLNAG